MKDTPEHAAKRAQLYRAFGDTHPALAGLALADGGAVGGLARTQFASGFAWFWRSFRWGVPIGRATFGAAHGQLAFVGRPDVATALADDGIGLFLAIVFAHGISITILIEPCNV